VENDALSALFGSSVAMGSTTSDEAAARALADAFAPQHFDDRDTPDSLFATPAASLTPATATPVFTPAFDSPMHTPVSSSSASDAAITTSADLSSDFSFDRFFPDPAAPHTPKDAGAAAPPAADAPPAPSATDDLAQFSAWLKGLGNA